MIASESMARIIKPKTVASLRIKPSGLITSGKDVKLHNATDVKLHKTSQPTNKAGQKPPKVGRFFFRKKGAGWECLREDGNQLDQATGKQKRMQPFIAHLSKTTWEEMKRNQRGAKLSTALLEWIEQRVAEKGI